MEHPSHWKELEMELLARGLPEAYIERLLGELSDHVEELCQERNPIMREESSPGTGRDALRRAGNEHASEIDDRLGTLLQIADATAVEFRRRTLVGRHPVLSFLLGPPVLLVLGWMAMAYMGIFLGDIGPRAVKALPISQEALLTPAMLVCYVYMPILSLVPPLLTVWGLTCLARRAGVSWRWPVGACLLVALLAGAFVARVDVLPDPGRSTVQLGLGLPMRGLQPLQALVVLLIGSLALRRHFPLRTGLHEAAIVGGTSGEVRRWAA